ncbi:MAG: hypothetical protein GY789_30135 [Hyphomicrobiales bacterium]|nr:hypothetical protein [Hyphomicrobiales bacterium]MCP5073543.1 hypothetical protein [Paracoccaceae bacterium]
MIREEAIKIPFQYAAGTAGSEFLINLRDHRQLTGSRCSDCERTLAPARAYCPDCGREGLHSVNIGPGAELVSWTIVPDKGVFALVRPDGADTAMLHKLLGPIDDPQPGIRLQVVFREERSGHINDIEGFAIVQENGE